MPRLLGQADRGPQGRQLGSWPRGGPLAHGGDEPKPDKGTLKTVLASGKLRVAVALYPPWAMQNDEIADLRKEVDNAITLACKKGQGKKE